MAMPFRAAYWSHRAPLLARLELPRISACTAVCAPRRRRQRRGRRAWWCRRLQDCRDGWSTARELQNHPHGQEPCGATRTESTRPVRRERARVGSAPGRGAAGRGQGGGAWLPQTTARRLLDERAIHNILFIQIGNKREIINRAGIPNLVSEVSCALCSAGNGLPRSSVHT